MPKKLKDKIALITGGTEGIGLATAKLFAKEGAYVFITGRRHKELDEAVKAIGSNVSGVQGDVAKLADLDRLYETVAEEKGRIDIVFANAGVGEFVPFGSVTEEHFDKLFNINVRGTLFTRANLDYRSEGPSYPRKRRKSGSDQYSTGEPAICGRDCADCLHHPDGTHGETR